MPSAEMCPSISKIKDLISDINFFINPLDISARQHSKDLDRILGFKIPKIEQKLLKKYRPYYQLEDDSNKKKHYEGTQTWIGLHPQVLQTPYSEISYFLSSLKMHGPKTVVDLGAGYGRVGIVMNAILPEANFIGYEIVEVRLNEAERMFDRLGLDRCEMRSQNLLDETFEMPNADIYFIYDFCDPEDLGQILKKLSEKKERFFMIAKGEGISSLIKQRFPEFNSVDGDEKRKEWGIYSLH